MFAPALVFRTLRRKNATEPYLVYHGRFYQKGSRFLNSPKTISHPIGGGLEAIVLHETVKSI
jgi:hypothetical protein